VIQKVNPGKVFGLRVADILPNSQIEGNAWVDQNAYAVISCNGGQIPCPVTVANWYGSNFGSNGTPRTTYYAQPVCSP